ncbi:hypothetical protein H4Q32_007408 [Labeo rohita]|uniref:Reelin domain-containing protein n=1 Tax=Labeo rohita TaxID=84645 RepID=A0ABQ8MFS0_LABRO|nr:hypothetical protein H4Q32_007408 [Labeo rohita]
MYNACGLLFLSFGFTMLKFITCYSDGNLLESECRRMDISGVSLLADPAEFKGFMLDARKCEMCESAGMFHLIDPDNSLLICSGRVVSNFNNLRKRVVKVLWTPEEAGVFFFRAAFAENYSRLCVCIFACRSICLYTHQRCALALLLFSRLCFLGGSSLLMIIRPVSKMATMIASVIELASKTIAVIFILIKNIKYECVCDSFQVVFTALTLAAMVSGLLHTITVFLHCGPSHEFNCSILWNTVLSRPLDVDINGKNQDHILERRISPWLFMFIIFSVFNLMFTAALMTGVSLVEMENC